MGPACYWSSPIVAACLITLTQHEGGTGSQPLCRTERGQCKDHGPREMYRRTGIEGKSGSWIESQRRSPASQCTRTASWLLNYYLLKEEISFFQCVHFAVTVDAAYPVGQRHWCDRGLWVWWDPMNRDILASSLQLTSLLVAMKGFCSMEQKTVSKAPKKTVVSVLEHKTAKQAPGRPVIAVL